MNHYGLWVGLCVLAAAPALAQEQKVGAPPTR